VLDALGKAELLVIPSEWYEGFTMVVAESYACGTPNLASRIGSLDELVEDGVTEEKFPSGDAPRSLPPCVHFWPIKPICAECALRRAYFDAHLTQEQNYMQLMKTYSAAMAQNGLANGRSGGDEQRTG